VTACPLLSSHSMSGVLFMVRGQGWLWLYYHDYCNYFTFDVDMGQRCACLCMSYFVGANIILGLIKMTKIMKAKNQLLVDESLVLSNPYCLTYLRVSYLWPH
jgi:hypothetical protein